MTQPISRPQHWPATALGAWRTFWFQPQPAYPLGLVRMAFGVVAIGWTVALLPDLHALFGPHGVVPRQPEIAYLWGVFAIWTSDQALLIGWILLLVFSVALMVGWHSRVAALAVFVLITDQRAEDSSASAEPETTSWRWTDAGSLTWLSARPGVAVPSLRQPCRR